MKKEESSTTMLTQQQYSRHTDRDRQERQQLKTEVGKRVMHALGQPENLYRVQVRQLWKDHYRVNVLIGADAISVKCAHSYYVVADSEANIIASTPSITRHYEQARDDTAPRPPPERAGAP